MENHYETLGLHSLASVEEIRRAYRILARRYHPDVNPGQPVAEERFKKIASAYAVLSDAHEKANYDSELERSIKQERYFGHTAFERAQHRQQAARRRYAEAAATQQRRGSQRTPPTKDVRGDLHRRGEPTSLVATVFQTARQKLAKAISNFVSSHSAEATQQKFAPQKVSVIEVSVTVKDAVFGVKKTVEISEPEGSRKISVTIPPGVRTGSVVHLRSKAASIEDLVIIVRVAPHPILSIQTRGLLADIPITILEAINGASISVPTLDEPVSIRIPPGSNSGTEIRVPQRGTVHRDGSRGDLIIRVSIYVPQSPDALGLKEKAKEIDAYYEGSVRSHLPKSLNE